MSTNYRVLVKFDAEKQVFSARAPELPHCEAEGATRAEAIAKLEEEIVAQVAIIREQGGRVPAAVDQDETLAGELTAKVSRGLQRELVYQARLEGVELGQLIGEMLGAALEARRARGTRRRDESAGDAQRQGQGQGQRPGGDRRGGNDQRGGGGGRYHNIMEDRASFVEYVRGLEQGGQGGGRPRPGDRRGSGQGQGQPGGGARGRGPERGADGGGDDPDDAP